MAIRDGRVRAIVGLGNPGDQYAFTRHNLGASVVQRLAKRWGCPFQLERKALGRVARTLWEDQPLFLFIPKTYMNESGKAVERFVHFFHVHASSLLIAADDVTMPFGKSKILKEGGNRGHNGMKSVFHSLGQGNFSRLWLGIGDRSCGSLERHVLSTFSSEEQNSLEDFFQETMGMIEKWILSPLLEKREREIV